MSEMKSYIVSYDIMDPKRLHTVHKTMKGFGDPIHYSVFRCNLTDKGKVELMAALTDIVKHNEDRIMIVDLGPRSMEGSKIALISSVCIPLKWSANQSSFDL